MLRVVKKAFLDCGQDVVCGKMQTEVCQLIFEIWEEGSSHFVQMLISGIGVSMWKANNGKQSIQIHANLCNATEIAFRSSRSNSKFLGNARTQRSREVKLWHCICPAWVLAIWRYCMNYEYMETDVGTKFMAAAIAFLWTRMEILWTCFLLATYGIWGKYWFTLEKNENFLLLMFTF
jgi:hypothetical protein